MFLESPPATTEVIVYLDIIKEFCYTSSTYQKGGVVMTYEKIVDFITSKMKMSHIYQPLLIKSLVDAGGSKTLRQLARFFLSQDESQLLHNETVRNWYMKTERNFCNVAY